MADEDDVLQVQLTADRQHVVGIALEGAVLRLVKGDGIRLSVPNMIEEDDLVAILEGWRDEPPHVLIAAVAVGEDHGLLAAALNLNIVAAENGGHGRSGQLGMEGPA